MAGLVAFLVFASEWLPLCHKEVVHLAILYASNQARQKIHFLGMGPSYLGGDGQLSEYLLASEQCELPSAYQGWVQSFANKALAKFFDRM